MSRKSPHSRAVARIARMLIEQGRELAENGRALVELLDVDEGRLRQLAGMVIAEVGVCVLMDARSTVMRREIASMNRRIRAAMREQAQLIAAGTPTSTDVP